MTKKELTLRRRKVTRGFVLREPLPRGMMSARDVQEFVYGWPGCTATELCEHISMILPGKGNIQSIGARLHTLAKKGLIIKRIGASILAMNHHPYRTHAARVKELKGYRGPTWYKVMPHMAANRYYPKRKYQPRFQAVVVNRE